MSLILKRMINLRAIPLHWLLVYLGSAIYLSCLAMVNMVGAADKNMLAVFMIDELVVYDVVVNMLGGGGESFLNPIQHVYGYLYHFLNAMALIILRPISHIAGLGQTTFNVLFLRELSALYYLLAVILLLKTFFKDARPISIVLAWFAMATLPAAFENNTWLHPDNLAFLLFTLTCVLLVRDRDRFGWWFWGAAVFWGLAINTKMYGVFLFPLFVYYSLRKPSTGNWKWRYAVLNLFGAGLLALSIFLLTMPFLFYDNNFLGFFRAMLDYSATYVTGSRNVVEELKPLLWYRMVISDTYFHWSFLLCMGLGIYAFIKASPRNALILLVAIVPMLLHFLLNVSWTGFWYLIPTLVPLIALAFFLPRERLTCWQKVFLGLAIPVMAWQLIHNALISANRVEQRLLSETNSPSIALWHKTEQILGDRIQGVRSAFRDPYVYLPEVATTKVRMKWGLANYDDLRDGEAEKMVDMVVLQKDYIKRCSSEAELRKYMEYMKQDFDKNVQCIPFYSDAGEYRLRNFDFVTENDFGMAFIRSGL